MNSNGDKKTLITIIVLLCIFAPCAIIGTIGHINNSSIQIKNDNVNQSFYFQGSLYFYLDNELLGTYECSTCSIASPTIDDDNYHTNYYKEGSENIKPVLNNMFAVFSDNGLISLYSIPLKKVLINYEAIKTYGIQEQTGTMIVKSNGLWGTFNPSNVDTKIEAKYEYLACPAHIIDNKLDMSRLIAKLGNSWLIVTSSDETVVESKNGEIVDFNNNYYVTYKNERYHIFDYQKNEYFDTIILKGITFLDNYIFVYSNDTISIYTSITSEPIKDVVVTSDISNISYKKNNNGYEVYDDEKLIQTIELASDI